MPAGHSRRWVLGQTAAGAALLSVAGCSSRDESGRETTDSATADPSRSRSGTSGTPTGDGTGSAPTETPSSGETATDADDLTRFRQSGLPYEESLTSYSGELIPGGVGPHSDRDEHAELYRTAAERQELDLTTVDERDETDFVEFVETTDFTTTALLLVQTRAQSTPVTMATESVVTLHADEFGVTVTRSEPGPLLAVGTYVLAVRIESTDLPANGVVRVDFADGDHVTLAVK